MIWPWPLFEGPRVWPDAPGRFGAERKFDIHTGVDLYTYQGMPVIAVEPGVVVAVEPFTGAQAHSPWWNDTQAVLVEGPSGVICYGEISPLKQIRVGAHVDIETCLGCVKRVLTKDKGRPMDMLHFELYTSGTVESVWWRRGGPRPENLLNPTDKLREAWEATSGRRLEYPGTGTIY